MARRGAYGDDERRSSEPLVRTGSVFPTSRPVLATLQEELGAGVYRWTRMVPTGGAPLPPGAKSGKCTELNYTTGISTPRNVLLHPAAGAWWFRLLGGAGSGSGGGAGWYGDGSDGALRFSSPALTPGGPFFDGSGVQAIGGAAWINEFDFCIGPIGHYGNLGGVGYLWDLDGNPYESALAVQPMPEVTQIPNGTFLHFLGRDIDATDIVIDTNNWVVPCAYNDLKNGPGRMSIINCQGSIVGIVSADGDIANMVTGWGTTLITTGDFAWIVSNGLAGATSALDASPAMRTPNDEGQGGPVTGGNPGFASGSGGAAGGQPVGSGIRGGVPGRNDPGGHPVRALPYCATMADPAFAAFVNSVWGLGSFGDFFQGGSSGAQGASYTPSGVTFYGGQGGAGGGPICIRTRSFGAVTLQARGGNGRNGRHDTPGTIDPTSGGGGGGSGNGGWASLVTDEDISFTSGITILFGPGAKGLGDGAGANGTNAGATGRLYFCNPVG